MFCRRLLPRWEDPQQKRQDKEGYNQPDAGHQESLRTNQRKLKAGKAQKAFGEKLASDHHVPTHEENTNQNQNTDDQVDSLPNLFLGFVKL